MPSFLTTGTTLTVGFACLQGALAGFSPSSASNVVVYWGMLGHEASSMKALRDVKQVKTPTVKALEA